MIHKKITKHLTLLVVSSLLTLNLYSADEVSSTIKSNQQTLDKIVAVINDDVITDAELSKNIKKIKQQSNNNSQLPPAKELRKHVLNTMILDGLQLQMAKLNNMTATPEQINSSLDNIAKQNNVNIFDLQKLLAKDGIDFDEFKYDLANKLSILNVQKAAVNSSVNISKQEIKQTVDVLQTRNGKTKYKLSHILISVPDEPDSEKIKFSKDQAERIVNELGNGKDFAKTAKIVSQGQNALQGGDMGWLSYSELPSIFSDVIPKLKKGQIYGPIQSENGFHIIKLTDVKFDDKKFEQTAYKVSHILIKTDELTNDKAAESKLVKLKQEIEKNKNFADVALIYSEDIPTAGKGGKLGWVNSYDVVPEFAEVITKLKPNQISKPFKTRFGWHLAKLEETKTVDNTSQWQENQAIKVLEEKKFNDALAKWQSKIKSEAHIKVLI